MNVVFATNCLWNLILAELEIEDCTKSKRNEVKKLLKQSEAAYWKQEFMNSQDPKQFWKLTNKVLRKSKDSTIGPIITDSKDVLTSDLEKASYFNEFFVNISEELTKNLEPLDPNTLTSYVTRVTPTRCDIELNWELVKKKIEKSANPNKATLNSLGNLLSIACCQFSRKV